MGLSSKPRIKPLLSGKVERPKNLQIDIMKYEFSKPYVPPVQIKTKQIAEEGKTDCVSDEEMAAELGLDYDPPCSQLTYEADIRIAKQRVLESQKRETIQGMLRIFWLYKFIIHVV